MFRIERSDNTHARRRIFRRQSSLLTKQGYETRFVLRVIDVFPYLRVGCLVPVSGREA